MTMPKTMPVQNLCRYISFKRLFFIPPDFRNDQRFTEITFSAMCNDAIPTLGKTNLVEIIL